MLDYATADTTALDAALEELDVALKAYYDEQEAAQAAYVAEMEAAAPAEEAVEETVDTSEMSESDLDAMMAEEETVDLSGFVATEAMTQLMAAADEKYTAVGAALMATALAMNLPTSVALILVIAAVTFPCSSKYTLFASSTVALMAFDASIASLHAFSASSLAELLYFSYSAKRASFAAKSSFLSVNKSAKTAFSSSKLYLAPINSAFLLIN